MPSATFDDESSSADAALAATSWRSRAAARLRARQGEDRQGGAEFVRLQHGRDRHRRQDLAAGRHRARTSPPSAATRRCSRRSTAGAVDVALGSGPGLGFRAKGVPAIGVAAMYGPPVEPRALRCSRARRSRPSPTSRASAIGVTTLGSLTDWLTRKLSQQQGWGREGIQVLPLGAVPARLAAMERNELDGMVIESATSYELEEQGKGRTITAVRRHREAFLHPRDLRHRRHDREARRAAAALPARLVQDRRLHEGQQGRRREVRRQGGRGAREHRLARSTTPRSAVSRPTAPGTCNRST